MNPWPWKRIPDLSTNEQLQYQAADKVLRASMIQRKQNGPRIGSLHSTVDPDLVKERARLEREQCQLERVCLESYNKISRLIGRPETACWPPRREEAPPFEARRPRWGDGEDAKDRNAPGGSWNNKNR